MQRLTVDFAALGFASAVSLLLVTSMPLPQTGLDEHAARTEAAAYLSSAPQRAERVAERWRVTDGAETAWLDAHTGALVEIEFAAPR